MKKSTLTSETYYARDCYPFGSAMSERTWSSEYRSEEASHSLQNILDILSAYEDRVDEVEAKIDAGAVGKELRAQFKKSRREERQQKGLREKTSALKKVNPNQTIT